MKHFHLPVSIIEATSQNIFHERFFPPQLAQRTENKIWKVFLLCITWANRKARA